MQSRVRRSRRPVELSTAMRGRSQRELTLGPHLLYPAKAAYTRARSYAWKHTSRGAPDTYSGIRILFYHRISDDRDELAVSPRCFIEQLTHLAVEGYRVVDVATAGRLLAAGEIGERTIGLSFDDGYRDVAETALPELERLGFAASVFVVPGAVDGAVRFGWYRHRPALLTWEQIARLDASTPLCIEAHSLTHPNLLATDAATVEREIVGSKRVLEERLGREVEAFSYPAGLFSARERRVVEHLDTAWQCPRSRVLTATGLTCSRSCAHRSSTAIACLTSGPNSPARMTVRRRFATRTAGTDTAARPEPASRLHERGCRRR